MLRIEDLEEFLTRKGEVSLLDDPTVSKSVRVSVLPRLEKEARRAGYEAVEDYWVIAVSNVEKEAWFQRLDRLWNVESYLVSVGEREEEDLRAYQGRQVEAYGFEVALRIMEGMILAHRGARRAMRILGERWAPDQPTHLPLDEIVALSLFWKEEEGRDRSDEQLLERLAQQDWRFSPSLRQKIMDRAEPASEAGRRN